MALTSLPVVGKLRASVLSSLITELRPLVAPKTIDETITSNATPQNDDEMFLSVEANAKYFGWLHFIWNSGVTPDFRHELSLPSGATADRWTHVATGGICGANAAQSSQAGTGADQGYDLCGLLLMGSTAGTAQWKWSQQVSDPGSTIVRSGSFFLLVRFA